jgi:hypothetical protein
VASEDIEKTARCSVLFSTEIKDGFKLKRGFLKQEGAENRDLEGRIFFYFSHK